MSNSLAKTFDKIVSKWGSKAKETKFHDNETVHSSTCKDDMVTCGNKVLQHESVLQRMKGHLGHTYGSIKRDHQQTGIPPLHCIINDLKDSPFKGKILL